MSFALSAETTVYDRYAIARRFTTNETSINVVQGNISALVSESEIIELKNGNDTMYSKLASVEISTKEITTAISSSEYKTIDGVMSAVKINSAKISATPDQIKSVVTSSYVGALGSITSMQSSIIQIADNIELKVNKNGVIASINNSGEAVTITASKINFNGLVTANSNFKILSDGSMEAKNGKFTNGTITSQSGLFKVEVGSGKINFSYNSTDRGSIYAHTSLGKYLTVDANLHIGGSTTCNYLSPAEIWCNGQGMFGNVNVGTAVGGSGTLQVGGVATFSSTMNVSGAATLKAVKISSNNLTLDLGYGVKTTDGWLIVQGSSSGNVIVVGNSARQLQLQGSSCYANGGIIQTSDRNKKKYIGSLNRRYEKLFDSLRATRYKYKDGASDRYHVGFIAQSVKEAILEAGLTTQDFAAFAEYKDSDDNETCGLRYDEFIGLIVNELQKVKKESRENKERLSVALKKLEGAKS